MKTSLIVFSILTGWQVAAQTPANFSQFDARHWGVVLEHPGMKDVTVKEDILYLKDEKGSLHIDVYLPSGMAANERRPAIIFLNGIGENAGQPKVKSWGIYKEWPRLMAAHGFVGISMESDRARVHESFQGLFKFLQERGSVHHVDADRLGVYAASANVTQSAIYLMKEEAFEGIKAAVLYYGGTPGGPYRKDLPVLFVIAEGDVSRTGYTSLWNEVLKNNAPWTIRMATGLPHAFDAFEDTDESRKVVKETISFWKNQLEPVEQPSWQHAVPREILSAQYMQNHNKAADLTKQWLDTHPDDTDALRTYSVSLKNAGRYAEAEVAYRKRLVQQPNDGRLLSELALVLYGQNKPIDGDHFMDLAIKTGTLGRYNYWDLAKSLYNFKNYSGSARYYELAVAIQADAVDIYNMACSYALANNKDKAFESLNKSIDNGFTSKQQIEGDADLISLRDDPPYKAILERLSTTAFEAGIPQRRAHHALVYDEGNKSVMMTTGSSPVNGGQSYNVFNDIWRYNGLKWSLAGNAGDVRSGVSLAYDLKQHKIYSYGGYVAGGKSSGELRALEGNEWKVLADVPEMKATEAGMVYDERRNKLVAFGGSPGVNRVNGTTWEWDGKDWKQFKGTSPEGRQAFAIVYDSKRNKTVVYGGMGTGPDQTFDDTWEFDGKQWTKVSESGPGPRSAPGYCYDSKRGMLIIFGGATKGGLQRDTWGWNGKEWRKLADTGPTPRAMGYMAYDKGRDRVVLFGGRLGWPNDANDLWEWDGKEWKEIKS